MNDSAAKKLYALMGLIKGTDVHKSMMNHPELKEMATSIDNMKSPEDCKKMMESDMEEVIKSLESIILRYSKKRRKAENVKESFENLNLEFKDTIKKIIDLKENIDLEKYLSRPFAQELFDKFCDYKFIVKEGDKIHEAKNLDFFKDKKIDYSQYEFSISMKEAEKQFCDFVYFKQWWQPRFSEIRQIEEYIISTNNNFNISINSNILEEKESMLYFNHTPGLTNRIKEGTEFLQPGEDINKTIMPSWIKLLSRGKICIKESNPLEKSIEIISDNLNGIFNITRTNENADFWSIKKIS